MSSILLRKNFLQSEFIEQGTKNEKKAIYEKHKKKKINDVKKNVF